MSAWCRSCGAPIVWAVTENGRNMPVDAEPTHDGNILLRHQGYVGDPPIAHVVTMEERRELERQQNARYGSMPQPVPEPLLLFRSHFSSCPNAAQHRRAS